MSAGLSQLGRYHILAELGRGAMGVVYKAEDPLLNRSVAIKTIIMSTDPEERAEYEARFYQEAKAAGGLNHPNVITIHDIGREGEIAYMAMELLEGVELRDMMKLGRVPLPLALDLTAQVADGLAFAHERGVVHRDIKPANIMIVRDRLAKIMDFGIARMRLSDIKTQAGAILGSPKYMSPEQVTGMRADHRSDIFSVGIILYELAAGTPPFVAPEASQLMQQIATVIPRPPSARNPSLPPMLDLIAAKALQKDPAERYQSATEFAADLRTCLGRLSGQPGLPPAALDKTILLDEPEAKTIKVGIETMRIWPMEMDESRTMVTGGGETATASGTYLYLSRQFSSAEGLRRFTDAGGNIDGSVFPARAGLGALDRIWQDASRRAFAGAIVAATFIALAIAFW